jgi:type IV pilus assembly protein PilA
MFETLRKRLKGDEKGFTLIELLVVIIILGILVAIAVPSYLSFRGKANTSAAAADLRALVPSIESYYSDNGTYVGMTPTNLQSTYDQAINTSLYSLTSLTATSYCAKATVNSTTAYKSGPSAQVLTTGTACT